MTNEQFFKARCAARITSVEIADYAGCCRREMLKVEGGDEPVRSWMVAILNKMIAERAAA